nr:MAG TPA: hypothetical protein [Caudoviricetes sp.]
MKKVLALVVATVMAVAMFVYWLTPVQPSSYQLHIVKGGETLNGIIIDANKNSDVDYDIREAAATAVAESKKMEGGAQGYLIRPGDKIAVPIYR